MATDFTFKSQIDPTAIARLAQDQASKQAQLDAQYKQNQANNILAAADAASKMVSASVEASKARQKREAVTSLANSLAAKVPDIMAPQMGPQQMTPGPVSVPIPLPAVSTPDFARQNAVKAAVQLSPESFAKQMAEQLLPGSSQASFGGLVPVVNIKTGERTFAQADKTGKTILTNGQPFSADWTREYAGAVMLDPVTQTPTLYPKSPGLPATPIQTPTQSKPVDYADRSLKERQEIGTVVQNLRGDDLFQSAERTLQTVGNVKSVLNQDLTVASGAIKSLASRVVAGERGVLTDKDVERQLGSDAANRFKRFLRNYADGKLTDQDYREMQAILQQSVDRAAEQYQTTQEQNIESLMTQYKVSEKEAKVLLKYRDPSKVLAVQGKKSVPVIDRPIGVTEPTATPSTGSDAELDAAIAQAQATLAELTKNMRK